MLDTVDGEWMWMWPLSVPIPWRKRVPHHHRGGSSKFLPPRKVPSGAICPDRLMWEKRERKEQKKEREKERKNRKKTALHQEVELGLMHFRKQKVLETCAGA